MIRLVGLREFVTKQPYVRCNDYRILNYTRLNRNGLLRLAVDSCQHSIPLTYLGLMIPRAYGNQKNVIVSPDARNIT